jgi:hypothetical protein
MRWACPCPGEVEGAVAQQGAWEEVGARRHKRRRQTGGMRTKTPRRQKAACVCERERGGGREEEREGGIETVIQSQRQTESL